MFLAALLCLASQAPDPIAQDTRLAAKLTIEVPIITLQALAKRISGETGVPIRVSDGIQDRKATLFVRDRPAQETMAALADTFFLTWNPDGKGYRLTLAKGIADEEAEAVRLDRERMKSKIDDTFAGWRELDSMSPVDQAQEQAKLAKELKALVDATDQASTDRKAAIERWLNLSSRGSWSSFAVAYNGHQSEVDDALMAGRTLFASTRPQDDCPQLGGSFKKNNGGDPSRFFDSAIAMMRIDFASARLEGWFAFLGERPGKGVPAGIQLLKEVDSGYHISKRFASWSTTFDKALEDTPLAAAPPRNPRLITLADQLTLLHRRTDAPIIADAYRVPCMVGRQTGDTIGDFAERLREFSALRFAKAAVTFRTNMGWLEARHFRYWRLEPREMSEGIVRPLEDSSARGKQLDMDSFATLAAGLTDIQIAGLQDFECPTIVAFPTSQLYAFRSLRLWNSLTEAQRLSARTQLGLALTDLETSQIALAKAALRNIFWSGNARESSLPLAIGDPAALIKAKLFLQEDEASVWPDSNELERMMNPSPQRAELLPGIRSMFCYGPDMNSPLVEIFTCEKR